MKGIPIVGKRFGKLLVVEDLGIPVGTKDRRFRAKCDCGGEKIAMSGNLRHGRTTSCGCREHQPFHKSKIREVARCKNCHWAWKPNGRWINEPCPRCSFIKDVRVPRTRKLDDAGRTSLKRWIAKNPGHSTRHSRGMRQTAILLVGKGVLQCVRCGCDRTELLEINHINGGGTVESRKSMTFYRALAALRRKTDDLELLCKPCNAIHALEMVHGPLPMKVIWSGQ
ncbi:hypothetical protein [Mesorhizobium sp. M0058]|uniref:hypothetical protein n=1 Tax=Mesorhizobium sp. M0058 TaxID=2956865 RepID=UPI003335A633